MFIQWFFVEIVERTVEEIQEGVRKVQPAVIIDKIPKQATDRVGNLLVDKLGKPIMVQAPKYEFTQWSAAYYPRSAKDTHNYIHAILRVESKLPLVINDIKCKELRNKKDWDDIKVIYPNLKKHWTDQPE